MGNCSLRANTDAAQGINGKTPVPLGNGVWKVKLVIDPKDLERILSEEVNTEALIQQMRIAANSTPKRGKSSWNCVDNETVYHKCVGPNHQSQRHHHQR